MHDVKFSIGERELGKADIEFKIKKGGYFNLVHQMCTKQMHGKTSR
jgi:hypothetical protein